MQEKILYILKWFKEQKVSVLKLEKALGFSNGLLGKAAKGSTTLSEEKWGKLNGYYKEKLTETLEGAQSVQTAVNTLLGTGAIQPAFEVNKINARIKELESENQTLKIEIGWRDTLINGMSSELEGQNKPDPAPQIEKRIQDTPEWKKGKEEAENGAHNEPQPPEGLTGIALMVWKNDQKLKTQPKATPITQFGVTKKVKNQ
jgi:hypothetical protein